MKLIDKDRVVAEIERIKTYYENLQMIKQVYNSHIDNCNDLLDFLDGLEVKEVDLVEELDYDDYMTFFKEHPEYNNGDWGFEETWTFGQYCYKLGLKAKGE